MAKNNVVKDRQALIAIRVLEQAAGRLRRVAAKRADKDVKAAWLAAAAKLAPAKRVKR